MKKDFSDTFITPLEIVSRIKKAFIPSGIKYVKIVIKAEF